jgi:hypothetical protein
MYLFQTRRRAAARVAPGDTVVGCFCCSHEQEPQAPGRRHVSRCLRRLGPVAALLWLVLWLPSAQPASAIVTIDWVTVGDPGNTADWMGYGAVAHVYRISKYEKTNAQYAEFLNAVARTDTYDLYNADMSSGYGGITRSGSSGSYTYAPIAGREAMPVNYVSWYDSLRFVNWLHNGQPTGEQDSTTTEGGAYTMITESYPGGLFITRNAGACWYAI